MRKILLFCVVATTFFVAASVLAKVEVKSNGDVLVNGVRADLGSSFVTGGGVSGISSASQYGYNPGIDIATPEDVWSAGGTIPDIATSTTVWVVSSDAAATATIRVTGLDEDGNVETAEGRLNGTTRVQVGTSTAAIVDEDFATTTGWTLGNGWSITTGTLNWSGVVWNTSWSFPVDATYALSSSVAAGDGCVVVFDVDDISSTALVTLDTYMGGEEVGSGDYGVGHHYFGFEAPASASDITFRVSTGGGATLSIDDVKVYNVDDWHFSKVLALEVRGLNSAAGTISAYTASSGGTLLGQIIAGANKSSSSYYAVPTSSRAVLVGWAGSTSDATAATIWALKTRESASQPWMTQKTLLLPAGGAFSEEFATPVLLDGGADAKITATVGANSTKVAGDTYYMVIED